MSILYEKICNVAKIELIKHRNTQSNRKIVTNKNIYIIAEIFKLFNNKK